MCDACSAGVTGAPFGSTATVDHLSATEMVTAISHPSVGPKSGPTVDESLAALWRKFGPRYQITKLLGIGGMGAVYRAWDNELGEDVALKVIRPDLADMGSEPERMFKRELQLARQVTHKNVIRIHDLGEVSGTKFISMPFVEGADLATILKERRTLPVAEAIHFAKQIAAGLSAAHEVGVVHRDLKPANILISGDLAVITDFGVAYSLSGGPSEAGIVGTLRYMAPEQAKGLPVDHRADVYAFGLIFHEMLCGVRFNADNTTEILPGRRDDALQDFQPQFGWPNGLNRILARCLAVDPLKRYGSAAMLADDLGTLDDHGAIVARPTYLHVPTSWPFIGGRMIARGTAAATLALLIAVPVVGGAAYLTSARLTRNALVQPDPKSVLIADFDNQTGDAVFNQLIESALSVSLEGASFIDSYSRSDAQRLVDQISKGRLDVSNARVVAQREGIDIVVAGSIRSEGARFRIDVQAIDPLPGTVLASRSVTADDRDEVLAAIGQVGADVRAALGDTTSQSAIASGRETFTAGSLEAASAYMQGQELLNASRYSESIPLFQKAVALDPEFGRAYASWAVSSYYIGDREESDQLYKKAFGMTGRMSERERLRTFGTYYLTVGQAYQEAITNYTKLVELYPADRVGYGNLAVAYSYLLNFPKALEAGRRALALYPASLKYRSNVAWYALYSSDFAAAATEAKKVLETDPNYFQAYTPLVLSSIVTASEPAPSIYQRMASTGVRGASRAAIGLADLAIYEGRYGDAINSLPIAIAEDVKATDSAGAAAKNIALAEAYLAQGARDRAIAAVQQALSDSRSETVVLAAARILAGARRDAQAQDLAAELSKQTQGYSRAYADIVRAEIALARRAPVDAVDALRAAQKAADLWLVHFLLGRAYVEAGRFPEAIAEFDTCVQRRGEATAIFLDDIPSVRYLATVAYWHGRAQEGLGLSAQATANYKEFITTRAAAVNDALVKDAQTRIAKLAP
jgi:eukaryotic-like serine/threonine-protein kinase